MTNRYFIDLFTSFFKCCII